MKYDRLRTAAPWLSLFLLLLVPIYAISVAFVIRSGVFNIDDKQVGDQEYRALWLFIASGVSTAATIIGLLFARSHNQRTLAFQEDIENRKLLSQRESDERNALLQKEASDRLALETAVKSLELLIQADGQYAPKARVAGALATLVHLGHPIIAMRTLSAAWDDNAVDSASGCWLISEVFTEGSSESQKEAAFLLERKSSQLCQEDSYDFDWPEALVDNWPVEIPLEARLTSLEALLKILVSRPRDWWKYRYGWAVTLLDEALRQDNDKKVRDSAALALEHLLKAYSDKSEDYFFGWVNAYKTLGDIRANLLEYQLAPGPSEVSSSFDEALEQLSLWLAGTPAHIAPSPHEGDQ